MFLFHIKSTYNFHDCTKIDPDVLLDKETRGQNHAWNCQTITLSFSLFCKEEVASVVIYCPLSSYCLLNYCIMKHWMNTWRQTRHCQVIGTYVLIVWPNNKTERPSMTAAIKDLFHWNANNCSWWVPKVVTKLEWSFVIMISLSKSIIIMRLIVMAWASNWDPPLQHHQWPCCTFETSRYFDILNYKISLVRIAFLGSFPASIFHVSLSQQQLAW